MTARDTEPSTAKRGIDAAESARVSVLLLVAVTVVVGTTAAVSGTAVAGAAGSATHTDETDTHDEYDELLVTHECDDATTNLTVENPNDEPVALTLNWSGEADQASVQVQTHEPDTNRTTATRTGLSLESTVTTIDGETTATHSLTTTIGAAETVSLIGLADETYELSATDERAKAPVPLDQTEVTLECDEKTSEATTDERDETKRDADAESADDGDDADDESTKLTGEP